MDALDIHLGISVRSLLLLKKIRMLLPEIGIHCNTLLIVDGFFCRQCFGQEPPVITCTLYGHPSLHEQVLKF